MAAAAHRSARCMVTSRAARCSMPTDRSTATTSTDGAIRAITEAIVPGPHARSRTAADGSARNPRKQASPELGEVIGLGQAVSRCQPIPCRRPNRRPALHPRRIRRHHAPDPPQPPTPDARDHLTESAGERRRTRAP